MLDDLNYNVITDDNKHSFPTEFQEAYEFLQKNEDKILFEDQYYASLEYLIKRKLKIAYDNNSNISIRDFTIKILHGLPPTIPPRKLKNVLDMMFAYWNGLSQKSLAA